MNAGKYRLQLGQRDRAAEHFIAAQHLRPTDPAPAIFLVRVAIAERQRDRALRHLEDATRLGPHEPDTKRVQAEFRDAWPLP